MTELKNCVPIASLVETSMSGLINGKIISMANWQSTSVGTWRANFILRDSSGQISAKIYRHRITEFEKKFKVGAELTVQRAIVKAFYRNREKMYELCIPQNVITITIEAPKEDVIKSQTKAIEKIATTQPKPTLPKWQHSKEETKITKENLKTRTLIKDILEKVQVARCVDVVASITNVGPTKLLLAKGQHVVIRDLEIIDESNMKIAVTLWHETAINFQSPVGTIIAISEVAVRLPPNSNTKSLTFQKNSRLEINPKTDISEGLKKWIQADINKKDPVVQLTQFGNLKHGEISNIVGILWNSNEVKIIENEFLYDLSRIIEVVDSNKTMVYVILWGETARDFKAKRGSVILATSMRIKKCEQMYCVSTSGTVIKIDPVEFQNNLKTDSGDFSSL